MKTRISDKIRTVIESIPENDHVQIMQNKPLCFVIQSKDLGNNWSPDYHSTAPQKQFLVELLESNQSLESILKIIDQIVTKGVCQHRGQRHYFHPTVRRALDPEKYDETLKHKKVIVK